MPDFIKGFWDIKITPLASTVGLLSNAVCILCITESCWAIHESSGRNPDCEEVKSLLLRKWLNRQLQISLLKVSLKMGSQLIEW